MTFGKKVRFIDLFAGIGGFHHAALRVFPDAECVMAVKEDYSLSPIFDASATTVSVRRSSSGPSRTMSDWNVRFAGYSWRTFMGLGERIT